MSRPESHYGPTGVAERTEPGPRLHPHSDQRAACAASGFGPRQPARTPNPAKAALFSAQVALSCCPRPLTGTDRPTLMVGQPYGTRHPVSPPPDIYLSSLSRRDRARRDARRRGSHRRLVDVSLVLALAAATLISGAGLHLL